MITLSGGLYVVSWIGSDLFTLKLSFVYTLSTISLWLLASEPSSLVFLISGSLMGTLFPLACWLEGFTEVLGVVAIESEELLFAL